MKSPPILRVRSAWSLNCPKESPTLTRISTTPSETARMLTQVRVGRCRMLERIRFHMVENTKSQTHDARGLCYSPNCTIAIMAVFKKSQDTRYKQISNSKHEIPKQSGVIRVQRCFR